MHGRYPHWLEPHTQRHWPYRVLCVDGRAAVLLRRAGDTYEFGWTRDDVPDWWQLVDEVCATGRALTVLSIDTVELWARLGLWGELESGRLLLRPEDLEGADEITWAAERILAGGHPADRPISLGLIRQVIERAQGYLCLSAPPLIARLKLSARDVWLTWIDAGNYGLSRRDDVAAGRDTAQWLGRFMQRYSQCCGEYRLGKHCPTAGGQAHYGWRYGHYDGGVGVSGCPVPTGVIEGCAVGGRGECYRLGATGADRWCLDTRACYNALAQRVAVPVRLRRVLERGGDCERAGTEEGGSCAATVSLRVRGPFTPYRWRGLTIYPVGSYTTTLAGPELQLAVSRGLITAWHRCCVYDCEPVLSGIAETLYTIRCRADREGDKEISAFAKLAINSLVGRFARRDNVWETVDVPDCDLGWGTWMGLSPTGEPEQYRVVGNVVQRCVDKGYEMDSVPEITAWITAAARVQLLQQIECAGWGHVDYVDTDCLIVDAEGRRRLMDSPWYQPHTLGLLGERWGPEPVDIRGIKYYVHGDSIVCSGVPKARVRELIDDESYLHQLTPMEEIRARRAPTGGVRQRGYVRSSAYLHGVVLPNGRVVPHYIEE